MTVSFDILDNADWSTSRRKLTADEIPAKVVEMVKRCDAERRSVLIPCGYGEDKDTQEEMTPYFAAAAELIGRQARVWAVHEDDKGRQLKGDERTPDNYVGFRVSVGAKRNEAVSESSTDDDSGGAE